jgi:hypothetical protein
MPSFQRLLILAVLGISFFANAAVMPSAESTDVCLPLLASRSSADKSVQIGATNENEITPDVSLPSADPSFSDELRPQYLTEAFAKVKTTPKKPTPKPKKTTAKATLKKTTVKATGRMTTTPKKTTMKATPTHKKTTAMATPTHNKTAVKAAPTHKKTTVKTTPTHKKTAAPKQTKAKPTAKSTSVKKTSTKPKSTKAKPTTKPAVRFPFIRVRLALAHVGGGCTGHQGLLCEAQSDLRRVCT